MATIAPSASENQVDAAGLRSGAETARLVFEGHRKGLQARRERDLVSEMLLLHIDGSSDNQWASIFNGQRVAIPRLLSEYRRTENLLRPIVDNAVAQHVTMPLRFQATPKQDRRSVERALIDTLWINHLAREQDWNGITAEALYMAMPAGFCPIHSYWRDGAQATEAYEGVEYGGEHGQGPQQGGYEPARGFIDTWVGNPFDTVFNPGAKRGSVGWCSYGRVLNADLVRRAFDHVPDARSLEGTTRLPSAAEFQRIARQWSSTGLNVHGTPALFGGQTNEEELVAIVCREYAPGYLPEWPEGRLVIVALNGSADTRASQSSARRVTLLADQPLPGGTFSWTNLYSHHRFGDVHGAPWVEPLSEKQVELNLTISKEWELIQRAADAPILASGTLIDDEAEFAGYTLLQLEGASFQPRQMDVSSAALGALAQKAEQIRQAMYTLGGYQAASRGEVPAGTKAYRAIVALQQADDTIHGPVSMRLKRGLADHAKVCWRLMKTYGDVPWVISATGDEYAHLAEAAIDNSRLSDEVPDYRVVSAFGASPELQAQDLLNLVTTAGSDGQPLLRTEEFRKQHPQQTLFDSDADPRSVQRRRARTVATRIRRDAEVYRRETGFDDRDISSPWLAQAAEHLCFGQYAPSASFDPATGQPAPPQLLRPGFEQTYPRLRSDDLDAHIGSLLEVVQDESEDPLARRAAELRLDLYYEWQASMAAQQAPATEPQPGMGGGARGPAELATEPRAGNPAGQTNDRNTSLDPARIVAETHGGQPSAA